MTPLYLSTYLLITYMCNGKGSQSVSLSCFQGLLGLTCKHKTIFINTKGISLVWEKKAMEVEWWIIWIGFGTNISVLESKMKIIVTILFSWYFRIHFSFSFIVLIDCPIYWSSLSYVLWLAHTGFVCLFNSIWKHLIPLSAFLLFYFFS